ncbi:hypothetical protein Q8F57_003340 [Paraburkholderia terrae]|uniref:hypothetical protein n=1 Tax=Paraburkholderia terrae TaxID=311230 RepID=UPI00296B43D1|nr:hypothetical protein [Paraburkholderia terrae]MDW3655440.1 hypothetical protein [Paraburkholderia terrae]
MTFLYHADPPRRAANGGAHPESDSRTPSLRVLPSAEIDACKTYRDACVLAWKNRRYPDMSETYLAMRAGLVQQHVSDYFHPDERDKSGRKRRELPAKKVGAVQDQLGNTAIAQWLARDWTMRLVEEFFAMEKMR